jgi:hypothetical protein
MPSTRPYAIVKHQTKRTSSSAPTLSAPFKQSNAHHQKTIIQTTLYETEKQDKSILFVWIPSHYSLQGNNKADQAARDAIQAGQETQESLLLNDAISTIKRSIHTDWETQWENIRVSRKF